MKYTSSTIAIIERKKVTATSYRTNITDYGATGGNGEASNYIGPIHSGNLTGAYCDGHVVSHRRQPDFYIAQGDSGNAIIQWKRYFDPTTMP